MPGSVDPPFGAVVGFVVPGVVGVPLGLVPGVVPFGFVVGGCVVLLGVLGFVGFDPGSLGDGVAEPVGGAVVLPVGGCVVLPVGGCPVPAVGGVVGDV